MSVVDQPEGAVLRSRVSHKIEQSALEGLFPYLCTGIRPCITVM